MSSNFCRLSVSLLFVCVFGLPAVAQGAPHGGDTLLAAMVAGLRPGDEAVRRIVERAMAAVDLAEARADQEVAGAQVRIAALEGQAAAREAEIAALAESEQELSTALGAALAEADRYARESRELGDTVSRLTAQLRRVEADREDLARRVEALVTQSQLGEQAAREAEERRAATDLAWADTVAALRAAREALEARIGDFQGRIHAYQNRSNVVEDALRAQTARAASMETELAQLRFEVTALQRDRDAVRAAATASATAWSESVAGLRVVVVQLRQELEAASNRISMLQSRNAALVETEALYLAGIALSDTLRRIVSERDALRLEIASAARILDDAAAAIARARAERDEARRGSGGSAVLALEERLAERDREVAALRQALLLQPSSVPPESLSPATASASTAPGPTAASVATTSPTAAATTTVAPVAVAPTAVAPPVLPAQVFDPRRGTFEELQAIPAVGPTRARAIVWYRENIGPIRNENDLKSVPGFNDERIRSLRPLWRQEE